MKMEKTVFGTMNDGTRIYLYSIENSKGMKIQVINYGAILVRLYVPDKEGKAEDIVLGYDKLENYYVNGANFGATIGPNANRIANASFVLDGIEYHLDVNDGKNNLHSHLDLGYHKRVWEAKEESNGITFLLEGTDGEMGFPGNKKLEVSYLLTEENELKIHYHGISDKRTILNMTNHSYFNLAGHNAGEIYDHILTLNAANYTPVAAGAIPTGEIASVQGTPMDFTKPKRVGDEIDADFEQLKLTGGYDHNWVLDGESGVLRHIATVEEPVSGRIMKVYTDLPGVQFYAGNFIENEAGKEGAVYNRRHGLCLETQYYPDTANKPSFPSAVFGPEREYDTTTVYKFEIY
ncbi:MAG TPA: galactose-1-epimerase [Lachnospiraceae bacterium]|nr:galactose-1-epimerase [Lachnospiraceae bacterium]